VNKHTLRSVPRFSPTSEFHVIDRLALNTHISELESDINESISLASNRIVLQPGTNTGVWPYTHTKPNSFTYCTENHTHTQTRALTYTVDSFTCITRWALSAQPPSGNWKAFHVYWNPLVHHNQWLPSKRVVFSKRNCEHFSIGFVKRFSHYERIVIVTWAHFTLDLWKLFDCLHEGFSACVSVFPSCLCVSVVCVKAFHLYMCVVFRIMCDWLWCLRCVWEKKYCRCAGSPWILSLPACHRAPRVCVVVWLK